MSFYLLFNHAGHFASSLDTISLGTTATGYDIYDLIAGPRSTGHRTTASSSEAGRGYVFPSDYTCSHIVVARADWLLTQNGTRLRAKQRTSGGTWNYIGSVDENPLATNDLIGIRAQDYVAAVTPTDLRGIAITATPASGTQASHVSKFYACSAYSFGQNPSPGFSWENLPIGTYRQGLEGDIPYEVEMRFTLTFPGVAQSIVTGFRALGQILNWPVFLYDDTGDIWDWKLEHCIIEAYEWIVHEKDVHSLSITFNRLRHYD